MAWDVEYCRSCKACQLTQPKGKPGPPMIPMPLVDKPLKWIGLDVIGPVAKSAGSHTHILIIIDYTTRYQEAIPLQSMTTKILAQELLSVFARVGFPQEVLTDHSSNFMSLMFKEIRGLLEVRPIRTSIYHPQMNVLVERFSKTLKGMLRKLVQDKPQRWHSDVCNQRGTSGLHRFSPFELLYGRNPRGILDLVRESWEEGKDEAQTLVKPVIETREHLRIAAGMARQNLEKAQKEQKSQYDKRVRVRESLPGQKVLLLFPTENGKLFTRWQGTNEVVR